MSVIAIGGESEAVFQPYFATLQIISKEAYSRSGLGYGRSLPQVNLSKSGLNVTYLVGFHVPMDCGTPTCPSYSANHDQHD